MKTNTLLLTLGILCSLHGNATAAVVWSGTTVDIRTGQPLPNVEVYGGARGRVDLTAASNTGADGRFSVTYDMPPLDLAFWGYYLLTATYKPGPLYFWHNRISTAPSSSLVQMVPKNAYIRGVVRDKVTGLIVPAAQVSLGVPGAYWETVTVSPQGEFVFNTPAYEGFGGMNNYEEGIPTAEQVPHTASEQVQRKTNYWLEVSAPGYRTQRTVDQGLIIHLLSSVSSNLHTWVNLDLVPNSTNLPPGATSQIVNPYAFQLWLAQYFTPTQMTNANVTGPTADPDGDGLTNQQEFNNNTDPTNPDTDNDGLPDGWEVANHLNPLVPDADQDPDNDSFSNRLEFLFGTDPKNAVSKPNATVTIRRAVRVDFPTISGVRYQLMTASTASGPWTNSGAPFSGNGTTVPRYFDAEPGRQQFYQLSIVAE